MELLVGPIVERPPGAKSSAGLRYAEVAPTAPLPKPATLARWRSRFSGEAKLGLRVPAPCWNGPDGVLRPDPAAMGWLEAAIDVLEPTSVVVPTGASITTGARDRKRLEAYFSQFPKRDGIDLVWRGTGLWEPDTRESVAHALGVIGGIDALDDPVPTVAVVHAELRAEGFRQSFSQAVLADALDTLLHSGAQRAYVAIESSHAIREAKLLQSLFDGEA
ncbi:MAG: hypothetical protein AAGF92_11525 [Myxococcota bacterium]